MKLILIPEYKETTTSAYKAIPMYYTESNNEISTKLSFNKFVNKMLGDVDNEDREIKSLLLFDPYGKERGIPVDSSEIYLKFVRQYKGIGAKHSYFLLKELIDFKNKGYLNIKDSFGNSYEELSSSFLIFINDLVKFADCKKVCLWCIRLNFFFI